MEGLRRWILTALVGALLAGCAAGGARAPGGGAATNLVRYTVRLPEPQTQTAQIEMVVPDIRGATLDVCLPNWRPGRYVMLDPATTVSHVRAASGDGAALEARKISKGTWRITTGGAASVRVTYRVYANSLNDRTRHIDDTHAFLSPESVFMYAPERRSEALTLTVEAPAEWRTATGLKSVGENVFAAPSYDVLVDSPLEIGRHDEVTFEVDGVPHMIVIWNAGTAATPAPEYDAERMERDFAKIVETEAAIFADTGKLPYERYVFLIHAGAGLSGGTEHLNSTIMQTSRASITGSVGGRGAYKRFLALVSHEMFHTWNVKRLRPADLKPYDYQHEDYSRLLWVAEGTTSYYGGLVLVRAGFTDVDSYVGSIAGMIEGQMNLAAWDEQSVEDASFDAWIRFGKTWPDSVNTSVSFYSKGSLISLLLDMELRTRTQNRVSLDAVMRRMYEEFPLKGSGYTTPDMVRIASELSGTDFGPFFRDYVAGTARPDFAAALKVVGLEVTSEAMTDEAYLGLNLTERDGKTYVASALMDGPVYHAGLMADDEVVTIDGEGVKAGELEGRLKAKKPGERMAFALKRRGEDRTVEVVLAPNPHRRWKVERVAEPTAEQRAAFESWTGRGWDE